MRTYQDLQVCRGSAIRVRAEITTVLEAHASVGAAKSVLQTLTNIEGCYVMYVVQRVPIGISATLRVMCW